MTEKRRMSKSSKPVGIVAPSVVFDAEFDFHVVERIRPAEDFHFVS